MNHIHYQDRRNRTMDIATLLESHRKHMLGHIASVVTEDDSEEAIQKAMDVVGHGHDRATTKTLLDMYRSGNSGNGQQPVGQASPAQPVTATPSRKVKAGSKAARQRALKAGETRRKNLADKKAAANTSTLTGTSTQPGFQGVVATPINDPDALKLPPATHLAPKPPEGGAA
jgi:hypothetical protein